MSAERVAALESALAAALRADAMGTTVRTRRAIGCLRGELGLDGLAPVSRGERGPGAVQAKMLTYLVDEGPSTEAELRGAKHSRVSAVLSGLVARGLVEAVLREGQACLWAATDAGREWVEASEAGAL